MRYKDAKSRFCDLLKTTNVTYIESGNNIHLEFATVRFEQKQVVIVRQGFSERYYDYAKLNLDRLYSLAIKPIYIKRKTFPATEQRSQA